MLRFFQELVVRARYGCLCPPMRFANGVTAISRVLFLHDSSIRRLLERWHKSSFTSLDNRHLRSTGFKQKKLSPSQIELITSREYL